jgi:cation transport regulator ChaC
VSRSPTTRAWRLPTRSPWASRARTSKPTPITPPETYPILTVLARRELPTLCAVTLASQTVVNLQQVEQVHSGSVTGMAYRIPANCAAIAPLQG